MYKLTIKNSVLRDTLKINDLLVLQVSEVSVLKDRKAAHNKGHKDILTNTIPWSWIRDNLLKVISKWEMSFLGSCIWTLCPLLVALFGGDDGTFGGLQHCWRKFATGDALWEGASSTSIFLSASCSGHLCQHGLPLWKHEPKWTLHKLLLATATKSNWKTRVYSPISLNGL